jgi:nucleotide-binding universal stress UspA family protein
MFTTAIVATDLSPASDQFISRLAGLKPLGTQRVILTHALGIRHLEDLRHQLEREAKPELERQKQTLEEQGFEVETIIAPGLPAREVTRIANEKQASMIIVGSHGATMAHDVLLGSTAVDIVHRSEVPVFIAQLRIIDEAKQQCEMICEDFHRNVLYPTDFSENAQHAFTYLEEIVRTGGKRMTLLYVQDARDEGDGRDQLYRMADSLRKIGATDVNIEVLVGKPKQQIVQHVELGDYTMILMGTQGRGHFGELLFGSVAYYVARHTVIPTLLVP